MKNLLTATLPALALLALGGCASTGALTSSTETDGVYYSSKDRTTTVGSPAGVYSGNGTYGSNSGTIPAKALDDTTPTAAATTEDANPDYQGGTAAQAAPGSDYYSNSYSTYSGSGFGQPYSGPGVSSFNYTPSATYAVSPSYYGSPYGYASAFGYGYSPFSFGYGGLGGYGYPYGGYGGFYDPFYSSFYSPFGYGSGLSIGFGYGFGGFGGFGYPYYGVGGYGYRGGYYDAYGYGGGYNRPVIYANETRSGSGANPILVGPRGGRGGSVMNNAMAADPNAVNNMNGRRATSTYSTGGLVAPAPTYNSATGQPAYNQSAGRAGRAATNFGGGQVVGQPIYSTPGATATQATGSMPQTQNTARRGFFSGFFGNGNSAPTNTGAPGANMNQGAQRRSYSQPQYNNAGAQQQQRSYSQPQRTFSQPSYSQPSYSQPSRSSGGNFGGGGGGGGGSFGGGGGGGGGRRGGR